MPDETTPVSSLDEQLDCILRPLGVGREVATLDEQLDRILSPLGVRREAPGTQADRRDDEEEEGTQRVRLYFISVLCEWADAPRLKERLEQLLASAEVASVLPGISQRRRCYFMIVNLAPFPPDLSEQLREWQEVDSFEFSMALDLGTDNDEGEGEAFGV